MAERYEQWCQDPASLHRSHAALLEALIDAHSSSRANQRSARLAKRARLPAVSYADVWVGAARGLPASLLSNLVSGDWIRRGHPLVITGPSGAGKTYLAAVLAHEASLAGLRVDYFRTPEWLTDHAAEHVRKGLPASCNRLRRIDLLILDDFALEHASTDQCNLLRRLIDARTTPTPRSTLIVSPTPVAEWDALFACPLAADALFRRLLSCRPVELKCGTQPRRLRASTPSHTR